MKRTLIAACAAFALTGLMAGSASAADAVGTVTLNGSVASKCTVVTGGTSGGLLFSASFPASGTPELADAVGHLAAFGPFSTNGNGNFQVNCNKANPVITLVASSMTTGISAPTGYANTITYTAYADFAAINGSSTTSTVTRTVASGAAASGPTALGAGLYLQNVGNNVVVRADTFATAGGASNILVAGTYSGTITVTITPS